MRRTLLLLATLAATACDGGASIVERSSRAADPTGATSAGDTSAPVAPLPRACTLLTAAEVQQVIAQPAGQMADDPENCMWAGSEHPAQITMLMVQVMRSDSRADTDLLFDGLTGLSGNLNTAVNEQMDARTRKSGQPIEGLGDAAWCSASNADLVGTQQLVVRSGLHILALNVTGMTKGERRASLCPQLETAGRAALARMGGTA